MTPPPVFERLATLGDTTRSRILGLLEEREYSVTEIRQILQLPQSTVSGHLRLLASAKWTESRADGKTRFYQMSRGLDPAARSLWALIRDEMESSSFLSLDRERARTVIEAREARSRSFFSEQAIRWDEVRGELYGARTELLPLFGLLSNEWTVADLGTGTGQLAAAVAPFVARVLAIDRSREMLQAARHRLRSFPNAEVREGELEALPIAAAEVDVVILHLVLHFVPDPPSVLAECARILRPGGRLIVVEAREHDRLQYRETMGHIWTGFEAEQLKSWLEKAGFEAAVIRPLTPDPDASGPLLLIATGRRRGSTVRSSAQP